jgi:hypothetical protein
MAITLPPLRFKLKRERLGRQATQQLRGQTCLAEAKGFIRDAAKTGRDWPRVEKRMQEIRKELREHFAISADPVPFIEGAG